MGKYNFEKDPKGFAIRDKLLDYLKDLDLRIDITDNLEIIEYIIRRFEKFINDNNKIKQQVFHLFVYEYLTLNDINVEQERETGSGPVDFCFSKGSKLRVLIEFKLSKNSPLKGLTKQLEKYKECTDKVKAAYFVCINVHKKKQSQQIAAELLKEKKRLGLDTKIIVIDGRINPSASNL